MKESNFISIVAYVHNSEQAIIPFMKCIFSQMMENFQKYEIIFINDDSYDKSVEYIKKFSKEKEMLENVSIIHMSQYHGLEHSMQAGIDLAIGDFIYEFDSIEMEYPESLIMDLYWKSLEGYDIVSASPKQNKSMTSRIFYGVYNCFTLSTKNEGLRRETFRIVSRRAINRVKSLNKSIPYRKVVYHNCGLGMKTIYYDSQSTKGKRFAREVSETRKDLAVDSLILFTDVVQKLSIWVSIFFLVFTLGVGIYVFIDYFFVENPVAGWTTLMIFLSAGFSGVFIILSIVLKYLSVVINMIFKKQEYLIESIEKISS